MVAHNPAHTGNDEKRKKSGQFSKGNFVISFTKQAKGSELSIYDIRGNYIVKNISLNDELQEINMNNQPKGVYFIEIVNGNKKCISKIVIQ